MKLFANYEKAYKVVSYLVTKKVYNAMFNRHIYSFEPTSFSVEDFKDLKAERFTFKNSNHKKLVGYMYSKTNIEKKAVMVFSHGFGGGGHHCYLNLIEYFCRQGFYVFAYDATANDESEGNGISTFVQGAYDADKAVKFVEDLKEYKKLPMYAAGHSWGAYSMSNVLYLHPRILGYIGFSGFNESTSIFRANGDKYAPDNTEAFVNFLDAYEQSVVGDDHKLTAINSFKNTRAKIAIVHSSDDRVVPIEAGLELYEKEFKDNSRFLFVRLNDKGHGTVYNSTEGKAYIDNYHKLFNDYVKVNKPNEEQKYQKAVELINRDKLINSLDEQMLDYVLRFISE